MPLARNSRNLISIAFLMLSLMTPSRSIAGSLVFEGGAGPGRGKHIVFLAGDHEYRSEESLPALARILAKHHGFKCTVLFNIDPATGEIVAGNSNMPGMEALDTADLAVVFLRFQAFPKEQMRHFDAYLKRGGPVVGLRTSTHAFKTTSADPFARYSFDSKAKDYPLGFGHQVLGQTWVGHYGTNHRQSTRITLVDDKKSHPILRGVKDVWVQAGAYVGKPTDGEILTMAQPLNGMTPDSPVDATKPPMPSEWTRAYKSPTGKEGRVFTSLYGTSEDITNEGYRRLVVNGCFWALDWRTQSRLTSISPSSAHSSPTRSAMELTRGASRLRCTKASTVRFPRTTTRNRTPPGGRNGIESPRTPQCGDSVIASGQVIGSGSAWLSRCVHGRRFATEGGHRTERARSGKCRDRAETPGSRPRAGRPARGRAVRSVGRIESNARAGRGADQPRRRCRRDPPSPRVGSKN